MEKVVRIVKKGHDESNLDFWISLTFEQRMENLEQIRQEVIAMQYEVKPEFQRVYRIVHKSEKFREQVSIQQTTKILARKKANQNKKK